MRTLRNMYLPAILGMLELALISSQVAAAQDGVETFDRYSVGFLPSGWSATITGAGKSVWTVEKCPDAPSPPGVLKQSAEVARGSFPICIKENTNLKDGFVEVKFKPISGKIDQAAGVIWRSKDEDNYYVCRANALEGNVVLYKVENSKRSSLDIVGRKGGYGVEEKVSPQIWNTLRVEFSDSLFAVLFNGKALFKVEDKTFLAAGKVGLWTKADSVMTFDDFRYGAGGPALAAEPQGPFAERGPESAQPVWESLYTKTPPIVDGKVDDVWKKAKPLTMTVREALGGGNPMPVLLRALHTDDTFYVMAQWPDKTKSDMRDPYVWNAENQDYERPSRPDDQFALEFPMTGQFDTKMLTLVHEYTADVWHWKAGRGNPIGWVDDKRHIISQSPIPDGKEYSMGGHGKVYIARVPDEGQSSYYPRSKPPAFEGNLVNSFEHRQPTGSMADVQGKAVHEEATWTLEMSRKFNTGQKDDAVIDPTKDNICAIAVLNDELYWDHSVSAAIRLRFVGGMQ